MKLSNKSTTWLKKKRKLIKERLDSLKLRIPIFQYHTKNQRGLIRDYDQLVDGLNEIETELYIRSIWRHYGDKPGSPHTPRYKPS